MLTNAELEEMESAASVFDGEGFQTWGAKLRALLASYKELREENSRLKAMMLNVEKELEAKKESDLKALKAELIKAGVQLAKLQARMDGFKGGIVRGDLGG